MKREIARRGLITGAVLLGAAEASRGWEAVLPVTGLDHVSIRAPDVRRAAEFYAKLFGTQVSRAENAFASAGSRRGELWFVRLGRVRWQFLRRRQGRNRESITSVLASRGSTGMG